MPPKILRAPQLIVRCSQGWEVLTQSSWSRTALCSPLGPLCTQIAPRSQSVGAETAFQLIQFNYTQFNSGNIYSTASLPFISECIFHESGKIHGPQIGGQRYLNLSQFSEACFLKILLNTDYKFLKIMHWIQISNFFWHSRALNRYVYMYVKHPSFSVFIYSVLVIKHQ